MSPTLLWFLIGLVFVVAELAVPGFILIFFGLGAWAAAAVCSLTDVGLTGQVATFLVASVVLLVLFRKLGLRTFTGQSQDGEEEAPALEAVGQTATTVSPISSTSGGKIKFRGSFWQAEADTDIPAGQTVRITGLRPGSTLTYVVEPLEQR
jgi:membrane protein implicated in regulation of membrane protease activity